MKNAKIKRLVSNRYAVLISIIVVVSAACVIPLAIKNHNDQLKHARVESVGITLIKSELEVYHYSHAAYPATLAELLKDSQVAESGGSATTLKVLPYLTHLRYNATANYQKYTLTYDSYSGEQKSVSSASNLETR